MSTAASRYPVTGGPRSVLVVDDQPDARAMLTDYLSSCGYLVYTAGDGLEAVDVAQRVRPSIILMDLMMPRMDGVEATHRLKGDARTQAIPALALTASAATVNHEQLARAAGCDEVLHKPCDLELLAATLRTRLNHSGGGSRPIRVLVVDDESPIRQFAARALTRAGYDVDAAASGADAISLVEREDTFDLFMLDVMMPGMEGVDLAQQLRARHPEARVLYFTGYIDHLFVHKGVLCENEAFLENPSP